MAPIKYSFPHKADIALLAAETEKALRTLAAEYGLVVAVEGPGVFHVTGRGANLGTAITPTELRIEGTLRFPASAFEGKVRSRIEAEMPSLIRDCERATTARPGKGIPPERTRSETPKPDQALVPVEDVPEIHWRPLDFRKAKRAGKDYRHDGDPAPETGMDFVVDLSSDDYGRFLRVAAMIDVRMQEFTNTLNAVLRRPSPLRLEIAKLLARSAAVEERLRTIEAGVEAPIQPPPPSVPDAATMAPTAMPRQLRSLWLVLGGIALFGAGVAVAIIVR